MAMLRSQSRRLWNLGSMLMASSSSSSFLTTTTKSTISYNVPDNPTTVLDCPTTLTDYPTTVPDCPPPCKSSLRELANWIEYHRPLLVLTGAGVSTESGLPDYRSPKKGLFVKGQGELMTYQEFQACEKARRWFWARNFAGWTRLERHAPNPAHIVLAQWLEKRVVDWLVTQNVDGLHWQAGSRRLIEMHGTLWQTLCMACGRREKRGAYLRRMADANPGFLRRVEEQEEEEEGEEEKKLVERPDGDVELSQERVEGFVVPGCNCCGGNMKPDIVMFGEDISPRTKSCVKRSMENCKGLLVLGTSLEIPGAKRIVESALEAGKPLAMVNIGPTALDRMAVWAGGVGARVGDVERSDRSSKVGVATKSGGGRIVRIEGKVGEVLTEVDWLLVRKDARQWRRAHHETPTTTTQTAKPKPRLTLDEFDGITNDGAFVVIRRR